MTNGSDFGYICFYLLFIVSTAFVYLYHQYSKLLKTVTTVTKKVEKIADEGYEEYVYDPGSRKTQQLDIALNKMTRRLRIEREMVESRKEELDCILSGMKSGVAAIENGGKILFCNDSFVEMPCCENAESKESLMGQSFFPYCKNQEIRNILFKVEEDESFIRREIVIEGEEPVTLLVKGKPLYKKSKRKFGTLLIMEDITHVKKLESIRRDFVSNVTHELKTPLTSIKGFVDTLKGGAIHDPVYATRFLDIIDIEAERLTTLVNDILTLSEIESGRDSGSKSMVCVEHVIDSVIDLLKEKKKDNVVIIKEMDKSVTDYLCNKDRLKELILNLADNGLKYTNEGSVTICCWEEEKDLVLQFRDTGVGIPKEHVPRLFERFYRVDKGRSRKLGGTGLGLSIVKHIVELYRGTISVDSIVGEGSVFTVKLPYYIDK